MDAQAGLGRRRELPIDPGRGPRRNRHRPVTVEVGRGEAVLLGGRVGEMSNSRGDDVPAPRILEGHRDSVSHAKVPQSARAGEAAELRNLEVHDVHCTISEGLQEHLHRVDRLVEDEGEIGVLPDRSALAVGRARLLDGDVQIADGGHNPHRIVRKPPGIGVGDENISGFEHRSNSSDSLDVDVGVTTDLELKAAVAFSPIAGDLARHRFRILLRNRTVEDDCVAELAAEERRDRKSCALAEEVPTRDVEGRLGVRVALQRGIHPDVHDVELAGVDTDQRRGDLSDAGSRAFGVSRQVSRTQRANFTVSDKPVVGLDRNDGTVEHLDKVAAAPRVAALFERQIHLMNEDSFDPHQSSRAAIATRRNISSVVSSPHVMSLGGSFGWNGLVALLS